MLLAVKKDTSGTNPLGGFHYMLHPIPMQSPTEAAMYEQMGYVIIDVTDEVGRRLVQQAAAALTHQLEVAAYTENELKDLR